MTKALLLSGGMDSIALAYWLRPAIAVTIDYGQLPAQAEVRAASAVSDVLGIRHYVIRKDLSDLGSGDLAGTTPLPVSSATEWWPYRNQMLITLAAMRCVSLDVNELIIGSLLTDSFHRDGTPEFVRMLDNVLTFQEGGMKLSAPAIHLTSIQLIRESRVPDEILGWAHSCHRSNFACGTCRGCEKHYLTLMGLQREPY
jgi:7-cyano-7-deazaguanine synthase